MKSWFDIQNRTAGPAVISIYDEIGALGIRAKDFIAQLSAIPAERPITLKINSPGGTVADGLAIYNTLLRHRGRITVIVDGLAGSIASVIAMAGDLIRMPENSFLLIHDPVGKIEGNADDMRDLADNLDKVKAGIVSAYAKKSKQDRAFIENLMASEMLLSAEEAVAIRFADEIEQPIQIAARFDLSKFANAASDAMRRYTAAAPAPIAKAKLDAAAIYAKWNSARVPRGL